MDHNTVDRISLLNSCSTNTSVAKSKELVLNTNGKCFLCSTRVSISGSNEFCLRKICRYLRINTRLVLLKSFEDCVFDDDLSCTRWRGNSDNCDFSVSLCNLCSQITEKLSSLAHDLELMEMLVHHQLGLFHKRLNNLQDHKKNSKMMEAVDTSDEETVEKTLVNNLRKETLEKCHQKLQIISKSFPKVVLLKENAEICKPNFTIKLEKDVAEQSELQISNKKKYLRAWKCPMSECGRCFYFQKSIQMHKRICFRKARRYTNTNFTSANGSSLENKVEGQNISLTSEVDSPFVLQNHNSVVLKTINTNVIHLEKNKTNTLTPRRKVTFPSQLSKKREKHASQVSKSWSCHANGCGNIFRNRSDLLRHKKLACSSLRKFSQPEEVQILLTIGSSTNSKQTKNLKPQNKEQRRNPLDQNEAELNFSVNNIFTVNSLSLESQNNLFTNYTNQAYCSPVNEINYASQAPLTNFHGISSSARSGFGDVGVNSNRYQVFLPYSQESLLYDSQIQPLSPHPSRTIPLNPNIIPVINSSHHSLLQQVDTTLSLKTPDSNPAITDSPELF